LALVALATLPGACAIERAPDNPVALACLPPETDALYADDYGVRLKAYTQRADAFSKCMEERGYVLNDYLVKQRLRHYEEVSNAQVLSGDPWWGMQIYRQQLRVDPTLWVHGT